MYAGQTRANLGAIALCVLVGAACWPVDARQPTAPQPRLLVLVVVDQMRAEYIARYGNQWTGGLRRLVDQGAHFERAFYPYLNTVTCVGHATLGTGAWPATHGIVLNQWYRRDANQTKPCTADASVQSVAYSGTPDPEGHSAALLRVPTLAERLRERWPDSRSVSLSIKARSAIMMAGKGATAVTWVGETGWHTSTAYTKMPLPSVARSIRRHPIATDLAAVWQRLHPDTFYRGPDDGPGERPLFGWTTRFPHPLSPAKATAAERLELWKSSPYSDERLGAMATAAIRDFALGQRAAVDFLGVSFSATDLVGHDFGPDSHEVQDTLVRLDRTLGALLATLDAQVGRAHYALVLSADHGVADVPEAASVAGRSAGRVPLGKVRAAVDAALVTSPGTPAVARVEYTEIYLTDAVRAQMTADKVEPALAALRAMPGIAAALWTPDLSRAVGVQAPILASVRASHVPGRSGDITIVPPPNWIFVPGSNPGGGSATTHGSPHGYDQHVPLVFFGAAFAPGRYQTPASPADAAPTLAATVGLPFTGVEGRPLTASSRQQGGPR